MLCEPGWVTGRRDELAGEGLSHGKVHGFPGGSHVVNRK